MTLRIAVVDSGINPAHRHVGPVAGGVRIRMRDGRLTFDDDWRDGLGHGTAVAAVISDGLDPDQFALLSVRIFNRRLDAPPEAVAAGIEWAVENGADLVNLSVATSGEIRAAVPVFAPAGLSGAIGVEADDRLGYGTVLPGPPIRASPWARPLPPLPREKNFRGVSFAVAAAVGRAARLRLQGEASST